MTRCEKFHCTILVAGALLNIIAAVPALPWRMSYTDTNLGSRFVMERYYDMFGTTTHIGNSISWFSLKVKMDRKLREFGGATVTSALIGVAKSETGASGASVGCANWQQCKDHLKLRVQWYGTLAWVGTFMILAMLGGSLLAIVAAVNVSMEAHRKGKKKKTKKKRGDFDECMEPEAKNFTLTFISFIFTCGPATAYVNVLGATLKKFQETAYYPYAGLSSGAYVAFGGQALIFVGMLFSLCRMYGCCGAGGNDGEGTGAPYQGPPHGYGVAGGYGAGYGEGYGGYEQHGGYGEGYGEAAGGYGQAGAYY